MIAPELHRARQWSAALAATVDEVADRVGLAARRLADSWPDPRGAEWAERVHVLRRALDNDAAAAAAFGRAVDRLAENTVDTDDPEATDDASSTPRLGGPLLEGPLLGATAARHADDRRGVTIPRLDDPADTATDAATGAAAGAG